MARSPLADPFAAISTGEELRPFMAQMMTGATPPEAEEAVKQR